MEGGHRITKIRDAALQVWAPAEEIVDFCCGRLLRLGETVDGGLDLRLEPSEEGGNSWIHGVAGLAEAARLNEMRQDGAERRGVVAGVSDTR